MSNNKTKSSYLPDISALRELYPPEVTDEELYEANANLLGYVKLLIEIALQNDDTVMEVSNG